MRNMIIGLLAQQLASVCDSHEAATQEAWWMLEKITQKTRAQLLMISEPLSSEQALELQSWALLRVRDKKPLQYILGSVPFCDLDVLVRPPILIPRPETEEIVMWVLRTLKPAQNYPLRILDMCSGSGCITLALAKHLPHAQVIGVDINPEAIALARQNQQHNDIPNAQFIQSDLFLELAGQEPFDLIISNPPYISVQEYAALSEQVTLWEDRRALVARNQGLEFYAHISQQAPRYLDSQSVLLSMGLPQLVFELGCQADATKRLLREAGFSKVSLYQDLQGARRWAAAWV